MTLAAFERLAGRRGRWLLLAALAIGATGVSAAPALATPPTWGVTMTHANPYGLQASLCTEKHAEPRSEEEELEGKEPCGVDPFTEKKAGDEGETFARESGWNTYKITVTNTGSETVESGSSIVGGMLSCGQRSLFSSVSLAYQWLRNGAKIEGATEQKYKLVAADEGTAIQCEVTASDALGATSVVSSSSLVKPEPSTRPPAEGTVAIDHHGKQPLGTKVMCESEGWTGSPTLTYEWLRNGAKIEGAIEQEYKLVSADEGKAVQCQVTATNAGGGSVAVSGAFAKEGVVVAGGAEPTLPEPQDPMIPVAVVAGQLPAGMTLAGKRSGAEPDAGQPAAVFGTGWQCTILPGLDGVSAGAFECSTSEIAVGEATRTSGKPFNEITLHVQVAPQAPIGVATNAATVSGGGAETKSTTQAEGETTITEAVPFGIHRFTTNDLDLLGNPFSQAGGHPFELSTEIVLNYTTSDQGGELVTAGGAPKEIEVEPPPGFVGNPQNMPQCMSYEIESGLCAPETAVGYIHILLGGKTEPQAGETLIIGGKAKIFSETSFAGAQLHSVVWNVAPAPGHPAEFGFTAAEIGFLLQAKLRSNGDYGVAVGDSATGEKALAIQTTFCSYGVNTAEIAKSPNFSNDACETETQARSEGLRKGPFLRNPTGSYPTGGCSSSEPAWTLRANLWSEPNDYQTKTAYTSSLTGCESLQFNPELEFKPSPPLLEGGKNFGGTSQADEPTGMTLNLKVPQTNSAVNATPDLKTDKMTLPAGMTISPSAADGLKACSNAQFGLGTEFGPSVEEHKKQLEEQTKHFVPEQPAKPASCPPASQIGTVEVHTPLLSRPLQGQLFVAEPECSPCTPEDAKDGKLFRLFLQVQDPTDGVIVKLHGFNEVNTETGRMTSVFVQQPQQPFELLQLKLNGGPRAPLANSQACGAAETKALLLPWSANAEPSESELKKPEWNPKSSFNVEGCPATMPFAPAFNAGTTGPSATTAGADPEFSVTFGRKDGEQDLSGVTVHMPLGLVGRVPAVKECGEAEVEAAKHNTGGCPSDSEIGTATSLAGPGEDPFANTGHVYFTGPYKGAPGAPFGLVVITPAVAGPFNLGNVVVRSAINIDPHTAAVTVTSEPLPQFVDGVQLRLREIDVHVTKQGFMANPTNCSAQQVSATLTAYQGASAPVSSPFGLGGCTSLPFKPTFTASTQGHTSKTEGASLDVKVTYPPGAYANIAKTVTELPTQLPSRLTTLQKACVDAVFEANPAACPEGSVVGYATAQTPLLNVPLSGPAYLVSHGGAAFPDLEIVLQGEGVEVILDGQTDIKKGITKTTFEALPDSPISTFELNLPEGPHSALAANVEPCSTPLNLPTILTGQNGAVIKQITHIAVIGCPPTVSIAKAKLSGNALLVTVKTSAKGTVWIGGYGLKTVKRNLTAGTHQIRVAFTKIGISRHKHHKKTSVRVKLTVGKQQVVAKTATVQL